MYRDKKVLFSSLLVLALTLALTGVVGAEDITPPPTEETPAPKAPVDELALGAEHSIVIPGTTLSADKTAEGYMQREFRWTIDKSVTPEAWDLFRGDSGTSRYTVEVTKDEGTDTFGVSGEICVTNGGASATQDLTIFDTVQYKTDGGPFEDLDGASVDVDLGKFDVLDPGESHCYPYEIEFVPVAGAQYRNVAHVTITNHSGWEPGDNNCPGPALCPFGPDPKADFSLPEEPSIVIDDSINVDDTNGGSWEFSDDGSVSYDKTFTCDEDEGQLDNTATIRETGQSDDASVEVTCYALDVDKDARTSFDRTYHWSIDKSADQSSLTLTLDQSFLVNYAVLVDMTGYADSNWAVEGGINIYNPAPMAATINGVADVITTAISATVECGVTFPYELASEDTLHCTYEADLPNANSRTNTATATLQNYEYDYLGAGTADGTTEFSGSAQVSFGAAAMTEIGECITVVDSYAGSLGELCYPRDASILPKTYSYQRTIGPYETCGSYDVENTAAFATLEAPPLQESGSDSWTVHVNVPCTGCTLTIGYWKTHAGFGPQADMVTPLLPQRLGLPLGPKTIYVTDAGEAVQLLGFRGSNDVFDASNGVNKLYAQLLGAKLSIASGADGSAVSSTILAADIFLSRRDSTSWAGLTRNQKKQVLAWVTILDNFNNGFTGPGHCSE